MWIIKYRKIWFGISAVLVIATLVMMFTRGFNLGIDFTGGALTEVKYSQNVPTPEIVRTQVEQLNLGGFSVRPAGDNGYIIKTKNLSPEEKESFLNALNVNNASEYSLERYNAIGPSVGSELKSKALVAISVVILAILLFIVFAFRKVSKPVASWKYGVATIIALAHDVLIPTGLFIVLGIFVGYEIDLLFVAALLAVMGYSVHDTIVVFDRIRENLRRNEEQREKEEFEETVGRGLMDTMGRSINTSITTLIVLLALFFFGGDATKSFTLVLLAGIIAGTYSSIFLASPVLVWFNNMQNRKK